MKPSERIEEIRKELINKSWIDYGGNQYSREEWFRLNNGADANSTFAYLWRALLQYLDETQKPIAHLPSL